MLKILYIDDNLSLTKLFSCLAQDYDFEALVANSIHEGIKIALNQRPDVIITDIRMPDGDGLALTAYLKTNIQTHQIPVVACSVTFAEHGKKVILAGGQKFVNDKPYSIEKLNEILLGIAPRLFPRNNKDGTKSRNNIRKKGN